MGHRTYPVSSYTGIFLKDRSNFVRHRNNLLQDVVCKLRQTEQVTI